MNAPLWVEHLHHHFLVGANSKLRNEVEIHHCNYNRRTRNNHCNSCNCNNYTCYTYDIQAFWLLFVLKLLLQVLTDEKLTVTAAFILASFIRRRKDSLYFLIYDSHRKSTSSFFQFDLDLGLGGGVENLRKYSWFLKLDEIVHWAHKYPVLYTVDL